MMFFRFVLQLWNMSFLLKEKQQLKDVFFYNMSHDTTKHVFGVCDQVRLKPVCSTTEASWSLEISDLASLGITLSRQRTTKVLIRLRGCAGWSAPLLFAYGRMVFSWCGSHINEALQLCKPRPEKTFLRSLRPGKTQIGLHSTEAR